VWNVLQSGIVARVLNLRAGYNDHRWQEVAPVRHSRYGRVRERARRAIKARTHTRLPQVCRDRTRATIGHQSALHTVHVLTGQMRCPRASRRAFAMRARRSGTPWKMARQWRVQNVAVMHRLSDLASVGDAGSEAIELAKGLLSDSQTRAVYQQASNELRNLRELLQLTEREVAAVGSLSPGVALWKVGQRSFVVEHLVSLAERWVVDTEPRAVEAGSLSLNS
jgi:hypothetical protein